MKITKMRRLISFGEHENISLECEIEQDDMLEDCHEILLQEMNGLIGKQNRKEMMVESYNYYKSKKRILEAECLSLEEKKEKVNDWLSKFNIPQSAFSDSEIPF